MHIFLTGATGLLGGELLVNLSQRREISKIYCLVRASSADEARLRIEKIFKLHDDPLDQQKVIPIPGDLTEEDLPERLAKDHQLHNIHVVIHSAANTSFSRFHADMVERVNITGLNHILTWAKNLKHLQNFVYVGTSTICGYNVTNRVVMEEESPDIHSRHFVKYTFTKMLGELSVYNEIPEEKVLIVRPSIIMGDSRPVTPRSPVILWTLAATNLMRLVPVTPHSPMDIIPVDYAAEAIARLLFAQRNYRVYHISASEAYTTPYKITAPIADYFPDRPPFHFVDKSFIEPMKKWAKKKHPVPEPLLPYQDYLKYWEKAFVESGKLRVLFSGLEPYLRFMELGQIFDNSKMRADTGMGPSIPAHDYIRISVEYLAKIDVLKGALEP